LEKLGLECQELLWVFSAHQALEEVSRLSQRAASSSQVEFNQFFNASESVVAHGECVVQGCFVRSDDLFGIDHVNLQKVKVEKNVALRQWEVV
jgi:hypothetical protein